MSQAQIEKQLDEARKVLDRLMNEIDDAVVKLNEVVEALKNNEDVRKIVMKIAYVKDCLLMIFPYINDASNDIYTYLGLG